MFRQKKIGCIETPFWRLVMTIFIAFSFILKLRESAWNAVIYYKHAEKFSFRYLYQKTDQFEPIWVHTQLNSINQSTHFWRFEWLFFFYKSNYLRLDYWIADYLQPNLKYPKVLSYLSYQSTQIIEINFKFWAIILNNYILFKINREGKLSHRI